MGLFNIFKKDDEEFYEIDEYGNAISRNLKNDNKDERQIYDYFLKEGRLDLTKSKRLIELLNLEDLHNFKSVIDFKIEELHKKYNLKGSSNKNTINNDNNQNKTINTSENKSDDQDNTKVTDEEITFDTVLEIDELNDSKSKIVDDIIKEDETEKNKNLSSKKEEEEKEDLETNFNSQENYFKKDDSLSVYKETDFKEKKTIEEEEKKEDEITDFAEQIVYPNLVEDTYKELVDIFGKDNIFFETRNDLKEVNLRNKEVFCFGVRNIYAYDDEEFNIFKQKDWFLYNIKKLSTLRKFKLLLSSNIEKRLFREEDGIPILINYKAINLLSSKNEFDFE